MRLRELTVGVEVLDVDPREPVDDVTVEQLRAAFREHRLLLFRGTGLSGDRQVEVLSWFGPVLAEKMGAYGYVSNVIEGAVVPEGGLSFHSDFAFTNDPLEGISRTASSTGSRPTCAPDSNALASSTCSTSARPPTAACASPTSHPVRRAACTTRSDGTASPVSRW